MYKIRNMGREPLDFRVRGGGFERIRSGEEKTLDLANPHSAQNRARVLAGLAKMEEVVVTGPGRGRTRPQRTSPAPDTHEGGDR